MAEPENSCYEVRSRAFYPSAKCAHLHQTYTNFQHNLQGQVKAMDDVEVCAEEEKRPLKKSCLGRLACLEDTSNEQLGSLGELNASIKVPEGSLCPALFVRSSTLASFCLTQSVVPPQMPPPSAPWWQQMWAFAGIGCMVSIGYMDPGNWGTDLQGQALDIVAELAVDESGSMG